MSTENKQQEPAKAREWWALKGGRSGRRELFEEAPPGMHVQFYDIDPIKVREVLPGDEVEALRAERDAAIEARDNALSGMRDMRAELDRANRGEIMDLLHAKNRIIALQDELAVVRNECATLAGQLNRVYADQMNAKVPAQVTK